MKIAVVDCKKAIGSELNNILNECYADTVNVDIYESYGEFIEIAEGKIQYDLLFINIVLGRRTSVDLTTEYQAYCGSVKVIFYCEDMNKAPYIFEGKPFGLLKVPLKKEEVKKISDKAIRCIKEEKRQYIGLKNRQGIYRIDVDDIIMFESDGRTVIVHCADRTIKVYSKLNDIQKQIAEDNAFIRCHQSFLINVRHVLEMSENKIIMKNDAIIPVARSRLANVRLSIMKVLEISG